MGVRLGAPSNDTETKATAQLNRFFTEGKLTEEQRQKVIAVLYDVKLNWDSAGRSYVAQEYLNSVDAGGAALDDALDSVGDEGLRQVRAVLSEDQFDLFQARIGPMIWVFADALAFLTDAGKRPVNP